MRIRALFVPLTAVLAAGCLASKGDIRLLQDDLASTRTQQAQQAEAQAKARARAESLAQVRLDSAIQAISALNDSLQALSRRFSTYQANSSQAMYEVGQQLITLQNRAGISQRQIQDLAAQLEEQRVRMSGDSTAGDSSLAAAGPGPATLFQSARNQYENGAYATARMAFEQLLTQYPDYLGADAAMNYVGQTYEAEGNGVAADSVYQAVVARYPNSPQAPTALYKHALWLLKNNKTSEGRAALQRVVKNYPNSTAAHLAADRLKNLPSP